MCGIAGIIGNKESISRTRLSVLAASLEHRGPDDSGIEITPMRDGRMIGLVHRRLSILDLSQGGHQPMRNPENKDWIVFNGEIYNFQSIRNVLEEKGHVFQSTCDTEVILHAYQEYGVACLEKFRGMFAFALWDDAHQTLFLATDRFGIKPLYVYTSGETFAFSSEVKALLRAGIAPCTLDPRAIESFLAYGAVQAPLTMIQHVQALLPGTYLIYTPATHQVTQHTYWHPERRATLAPPMRDVLLDSVRHHLVSDVPVALFLSGGVDSSALAILAHDVAEGPSLDSFSVTFAEQQYAEGKYAKMIGEKFCRHHNEITLSNTDLRAMLPAALAAMDQPTVDGLNVYVLASAVRGAGIKVVLSGQGGDEVFGGYSTFRHIIAAERLLGILPHALHPPHKNIAALVRLADRLRGRSSFIDSKLSQLLAAQSTPLALCLVLRQMFGPHARQQLLPPTTTPHTLINGIPASVVAELETQASTLDLFSQISLFELRLYLANMLLRDGDVMSMAHSIEVRVPFLDHHVVDAVFSAPDRAKRDAVLPKPLLLRAVIDRMPREIYDRKKMGFTFPWEVWLRGPMRDQVDALLGARTTKANAFINQEACTALWKEFLAHKKGVSWSRVWTLYILLQWIERNT